MFPQDPRFNPNNPDVNIQGLQFEKNPDAAYGDHIKNCTAICNSSASHTYGNVMAVVEKYLLDLFPPDLFKTVTASTTLASRQVLHLPHQLKKVELPVMVLIPRIVFGQEDNRFLGHTIMNDKYTNTHALWSQGSMISLADDIKKNIHVHGQYNRALLYIDVIMAFNTYAEQINWMSYLYNMVPINHNQFVRAPLELYIPESFCTLISHLSKVPIKDDKGSVYNFLTQMNSMFYHPITYKLKGGSNSDEFFMYYLADIDTVIQDPQAGEGIKDGQLHRNFDIRFTVRCEFNTVGCFMLSSPEIRHKQILPPPEDKAVTTLFSDSIDLNDFDLPVGWTILGWPIFKLAEGESSISIENILNESINRVIDYHLEFNIPMERFIQIQFRENGQILDNELYYIDWHKRELHLSNPNYRRTYRLLITISHDYINNLVKELYNLE